MATQLHHHVPPGPPALSEAEWATARWEDDGGNLADVRPHAHRSHWLRIAAALSARLPDLTGREDILVICEDGTRSGAPAAFYPALAQLEIDTALFAPLHPATIRPARPGDEDRYPAAWGAFVHEAAHATHSRWRTPPPLRGTALDEAGQILEESRAERAHLCRRPRDRRYLRAATRALILTDFAGAAPTDRWRAALAAGLVLARRDAGILDPDETRLLESTLTGVLGADLLHTLAGVWTAAHATGDEDGRAMMGHARAWCRALGADSTGAPPRPEPAGGGSGELAEAVGKVVAQVQVNEAVQRAAEARITVARAARAQDKADRAAQARRAAKTAEKVFSSDGRPFTPGGAGTGRGRSPVTGTRPPEAGERAAAGRLARALRAAAYRERVTTHVSSAIPPGRLDMRQALARDAQRAAGATPTATPWSRTVHRPVPTPPLRIGVAVDVSGSMRAAAAPLASAAWILARAAALTGPDSRTATVAYHRSVTAITVPGRVPRQVTQFGTQGGGHCLAEAVDALSAGLRLDRPGAGRLLVIASDGRYTGEEAACAARRVVDLRREGCAVLWLAFAPGPRALPGSTVVVLQDPARAVTAIAKAAASALAGVPAERS